MATIQLTLYNLSTETNKSIVIFQELTQQQYSVEMLAWRVVKNCPKGWSFPFTFSSDLTFSVTDPDGNVSPQGPIEPGQLWVIQHPETGTTLTVNPTPLPSGEMGFSNGTQTMITATIYRDQKAMMIYSIPPHFNTMFSLPQGISIAVAPGPVAEGDPINLSGTGLDLSHIGSADIIMSNGGSQGPVTFETTNRVPR